jgi:H/ACA ribonucleoprotein complex subunit 4|tara:strand:+ start:2111 stop:3109 length:999 start_codon:yes stop_codon:yes gene_type:complete
MKHLESNNHEQIIIDEEPDITDSGSYPNERKIDDLLDNCIIFVDKQSGPTSHQIVSWVRSMLNQKKAGHSGTLDPQVTGLLPIGLGNSTKALPILLYGPKEYVAVLRLHNSVNRDKLYDCLENFKGPIYQRPPQRSAVKRVTRTRTIHELEVLDEESRLLCLRVLCEAGTYIRKLVYDIGEIMQCGATMIELRRTRVMHIDEQNHFVRLHELSDAVYRLKHENDETKFRQLVQPVEFIAKPLKSITVRCSAIDSLCHGAQLAIPGILKISKGISKHDNISILSQKGELIALADALLSSDDIVNNKKGIACSTKRVIMKPDTYPKLWKNTEND